MPVEHNRIPRPAPFVALATRMVAAGALAAALVLAGAAPALAQGPEDYIVTFREGTGPAIRAAAAQSAGSAVRIDFRRVNAAAIRVPNVNALAALRNHPAVLAIVPDRPVFAYQNGKGKPAAGGGSSQIVPAGVVRVGAPTPSSNGDSIGVAVLDTGIDLTHADLAGTVDAFSAFGGSCQDDQGHGTHVAGIVAARDNGIDVVGVAPKAALYCVKVLNSSGSGSDATVMAGLEWVLDNHSTAAPAIKVVNMSLGRRGSVDDNPSLHHLIQTLVSEGVAVVVAAGNDPNLEVRQQIPAAYPAAIAVASTTAVTGSNQCRWLSAPIAADTASYFTSDGTTQVEDGDRVVNGVTVSAPGEDQENVNKSCLIQSVGILSTRLGGGTTRMSGTSMAAPHVAGIVARYFQTYSGAAYDVEDIRSYLRNDADRRGVAPLDSPTSSYTFDGEREGVARAP